MRTLPAGIDQRSASRHPDWVGPDDLRIKIEELREATEWAIPIYVKIGATRVDHDVKLAVAAGADVVVVDGMQGGTAATQDVFIEHAGIPTLPAVRLAAEALRRDRDERRGAARSCRAASARVPTWPRPWPSAPTPSRSASPRCWLSAATGPPTGRRRRPDRRRPADYAAPRAPSPGHCAHCHTGRVPGRHHHPGPRARGPARSRPRRRPRWPTTSGRLTMEVTALARACGKVRRPPPRTRGPGRADRGGRGHGQGARWPGPDWIPGWHPDRARTVSGRRPSRRDRRRRERL